MSYSVIVPEVVVPALLAIASKENPTYKCGWDAAKKLSNTLYSALAQIEFTEKSAKDGAKPKRLKLQRKKHTASYGTSMGGETKMVSARALDCYEWLWDIEELEQAWPGTVASVEIPAQLADWLKTLYKPKASETPHIPTQTEVAQDEPLVPAEN
jgi:hypothetical protein